MVFKITVGVNLKSAQIILTPSTVMEGTVIGTLVGSLSVPQYNSNVPWLYTLIDDAGGSFTLSQTGKLYIGDTPLDSASPALSIIVQAVFHDKIILTTIPVSVTSTDVAGALTGKTGMVLTTKFNETLSDKAA